MGVRQYPSSEPRNTASALTSYGTTVRRGLPLLDVTVFFRGYSRRRQTRRATTVLHRDLDIANPDSFWAQAGKRYAIDPLLIYAVALVESRQLVGDNEVAPTPWVVRINDHLIRGDRAKVQSELQLAHALAAKVQDVGIMQVYYPAHYQMVTSPMSLLEPRTNIMVGAKLLAKALTESPDREIAVGHYHSRTPDKARFYGRAVLTVYSRLRSLKRRTVLGVQAPQSLVLAKLP